MKKFKAAPLSTITSVSTKRMKVLTKEQFGESGLPGAQFVQSQALQYPSASKYSLTRAALMGLLGAGAGVGAGKYAKKSKALGGAIGGASGVAASLLYDALRKGEEFDVAAAGAMANGKGAIMLVAPKRLIVNLKANKATAFRPHFGGIAHFVPIVTSDSTGIASEYPGWAGSVMQHGFLTQRCMMHYIHQHAKYREPMQVEPHWGFWTKGWSSDSFNISGNGISSTADKNYSNGTLWTNRFSEWPSPIFRSYGIGTPKNGDVQSAIADLIVDHVIDGSGGKTRRTKNTSLVDALSRYANNKNKYKDNRKVHADDWFDSGTRMDQFNARYGRTVQRAQWFVWAAEMFRVHASVPLSKIGGKGLDNWWYDHCAQWGVGCASDDRRHEKKSMVTYQSDIWLKDQNGEVHPDYENPLIVSLHHNEVVEYLKLVAQVTPPPFTTSPGQQITIWPDGTTREFLDFPEDFLGSIVPPMDLINKDWYEAIVARQLAQGAPKSMRIFIYIVGAVIELVTTYFGGPAGVVIGAAMSCVMTLTRLAMTNNGQIGAGDISKVIGTMVSAIADVADLSAVSGGFTDVLNNFQDVLDDSGLASTAKLFLDLAENLSSDASWPYINDLLATTNDVERSTGLDVESAISNL